MGKKKITNKLPFATKFTNKTKSKTVMYKHTGSVYVQEWRESSSAGSEGIIVLVLGGSCNDYVGLFWELYHFGKF